MTKKIIIITLTLICLMTTGCGQNLPFEYRYESANVVLVKYMDVEYKLNRYGEKVDTPFRYNFESDGDIDITIAGKTYDIDSPYDIDKRKVSKKKKISKTKKKSKTSKKKTASRKKKK